VCYWATSRIKILSSLVTAILIVRLLLFIRFLFLFFPKVAGQVVQAWL
jgi:hypothetical protein